MMLTRNQAASAAGDAMLRMPPSEGRGQRFATFTPNTYSSSAHSVEAVLSVGAPVNRCGFVEMLAIAPDAIDLTRAQAGLVPLLNAHNAWDVGAVLGSVTNVRIAAGQLLATLVFGQTDIAQQVEGMVSRGELRGVSIGYNVTRWELIAIDAETDVSTWLATRWELMETSFVPVPADPNTGVRSAARVTPEQSAERAAHQEEDEMNMLTRNAPGGAAAPAPASAPAASAAAAPAAADPATRSGEPVVARFTGSTALALIEQARAFGDTVVTRAQELIAQNERGEISVEGARAAVLTAAADAQRAATGVVSTGGRAIEITADARDKFCRGAANSIIHRAGLVGLHQRAATARGETIDLDPGEFRGIRNAELARLTLERAGQRVDSFDRDLVVGQALSFRSGPLNAVGDFPVILESVVNRTLQASYAVTPDTWMQFCATGSVSDFRPTYNLLRGTFGALDPVLENGEIKTRDIPDGAKEAIQAGTKGNIIGLTRQAIVNDDLGAFNEMAVELGRAGKLSVEVDVYKLLALNGGLGPLMNDGKTLFHADHGNIVNPGGPLSVAQVELMDLLFANQKDLSGNEFLDMRLSVLLVPRGQRGDALVINESQYDTDTAGKFQKPNKVRGLFDDVVGTPRLAGTRRYGFADPAVAPTIKVVFLNGNQEPRVETKDGWRIDGTEWRVLFDYGVGAVNYRSGVTDPGA